MRCGGTLIRVHSDLGGQLARYRTWFRYMGLLQRGIIYCVPFVRRHAVANRPCRRTSPSRP